MTPPTRFRAVLKNKITAEARRRGLDHNKVAVEFVLQRFLARVFAEPDSPWVLKGGTCLLARLPGARHSQDVDLLHPTTRPATAAVAELRALSRRDCGDHLDFELAEPRTITGGIAVTQIQVQALLQGQPYQRFTIDLSTEITLVTGVDRLQPTPVVTVPELAPLPEFALQPLPNQVADKVSALYERPPASPSTRYRDLVDLVLITTHFPLDADLTRTALDREAHRRGFTLPERLHPPGPLWADGYRQEATRWNLPAELRNLDHALRAVGACLDPVLANQVTTVTWSPSERCWQSHPAAP